MRSIQSNDDTLYIHILPVNDNMYCAVFHSQCELLKTELFFAIIINKNIHKKTAVVALELKHKKYFRTSACTYVSSIYEVLVLMHKHF